MILISRADLVLSALAFSISLFGVAALLVATWRRRAVGSLVWFGLFSVLYGARVALAVPTVAAALHVSAHRLAVLRFDITYVLALPLMLLVREFVGIGWRYSMRIAVWVSAAYSIGGVLVDAVTKPGTAMAIKPYVIVGLGVAAFANTVIRSRRTEAAPRALAVGFLSFLVTVGAFNLGQIVHGPVSPRFEVAGFVALLACLAYSVLVRAVDTEAQLVSIQREIDTAQRIQNAILPAALPRRGGLSLAVRYQPMTTMAGDFYDFVDGPDCLRILIADASGHGVPAALIASMLKVAVSTEAPHAADTGALLTAVNTSLVPLLSGGRDYVTACCISVDPAARWVRYARAGHPPPLVRLMPGDVRTLDAGGTILGQFDGMAYDETAGAVQAGSRILLYTDGIIEAADSAGEFFGLDRLRAWLAADRSATAAACADALLEAVAAWRQRAPQADDVTVIVADVGGAG